ncbi:lauroyl acyltransferase [Magnetovibrio sp.]|uniref:lysophospholipid acyltransferase family protein n=1 Tax=Magnetovibrio sp. TaxID=2024836 RepID=UPI002F94D1DB
MAESLTPLRSRKATVLDYIGAGFAYGGVFVLRLLPFGAVSALGGLLARSIGPLLKPSKAARKNLHLAFPEKSQAEIEAIVREVWDTMGRTAFEFAVMDRLLTDSDKDRVEIEGQEHIDAAFATGKPVLFFGAHLGNWELLPVSAGILGFGVNIFYRAPNNPLLQSLFAKRSNPGELIPKGAPGAKRAFTLLKRGQHLGILVDQKLNDGIAVPFFGRDAMTGTALAEFALRFDSPVVPIQCIRLPGARFKLIYHPPLNITRSGDKKADVRAIMADVNAMMESWIRERPGQWLWLHKRWPR